MDIKVSIIIPIFNVSSYLSKCLESIIAQSYNNIEIICVNDGSTDDSLTIVNSFCDKDNRIVIVNKENGGLTSARFAGWKASTGDFLMFVDGDDWIGSNTIDDFVDAVIKYDVDIVLSSYIREYPNRSLPVEIYKESKFFDNKQVQIILRRRMIGLVGEELKSPQTADSLVSCWMKLYRRELIVERCFVSEREVGSAEDALFNAVALENCKSAFFLYGNYYHYRKLDSSLTGKHKNNLPQLWSYLFLHMQQIVEASDNLYLYQMALNNRIALSIVGLGLNTMVSKENYLTKRYEIKKLLADDLYINAVKKMEIKMLPFAWKVLIISCKWKLPSIVYLCLFAIKILKSRVTIRGHK